MEHRTWQISNGRKAESRFLVIYNFFFSFSIVASQFIKFIFNAVSLILHIDFMNIFYYRVLRNFIIKNKANIECFAYYYKRQLC